ncbi:MAG: hypothetical protein GF353_06770 [Candidatus Lokiarchaeota archaeon]|nr:hypothetical protein [Candidatus Lokiarchaeota archaeon]
MAVVTKDDYILIRKVEVPDWDEIFSKGELIAKKQNISPEDVLDACSEARHRR